MKLKISHILFLLAGLIFANLIIEKYLNLEWDFTSDKRYTLSTATSKIIDKIDKPTQIIVFLEGDFPAYFKKLQAETNNLLADFKKQNPNIEYVFINPLEKGDSYLSQLVKKGMEPSRISVKKSGKLEQILLFPWAVIKQGNKEKIVPLLSQSFAATPSEQIQKSIEGLEFNFANALQLLQNEKSKKIAILKGNGELRDIYIADFLQSLGKKYRLAPFTLDSIQQNPQKTLKDLKLFDLLILAKPTEKFSEKEKFAMDQYIMSGGKMLMLIDEIKAHKDTLMYHGKTYALNAELNLTDFLFNYGVRINPQLVKDIIAAPVVLKVGEVGNRPQLEQFPWFYSPLIRPEQDNSIGKNVDMVLMDFASPMDTLKNPIKKTILLQTSPKTQLVGVPIEINFSEIGKKPNLEKFKSGQQILGVLLEGKFTSAYKGRVKPFPIDSIIDKNNNKNAMIVISDGDIIKNQLDKDRPLELGYDKWSKMKYDNKLFLTNAVDYLLDSSGLVNLKNKKIKLILLDQNKALAEQRKLQFINLFFPLMAIGLFIFIFGFYRKRKYSKL
jgi:gliding-associated putative ABC transporter substrate-binding component GldG